MQNINKNNELNKTDKPSVIKVDDAWFEKHGFKKLIYMIRGYRDYRKGKKGEYGK